MDRAEALAVAERELERLRSEEHAELARLVDRAEWIATDGPSGQRYEVQFSAVWDAGVVGHDLRVVAAIGDGSRRRFILPLSTAFIVAPDGTFVGE